MDPLITTKPPGPNARAIIARDAKVISHSLARQYPLVLRNASGINLWDVDGNRYLDLTAGFAVMNVGWNHPNVVRAVEHQIKYLSHGSFLSFYSDVPVTFAERLTDMLPPPLNQLYLSNSGAESVEAAMKLARHHTKRKYSSLSTEAFTDELTARSALPHQREFIGGGSGRSCRFFMCHSRTRIVRITASGEHPQWMLPSPS